MSEQRSSNLVAELRKASELFSDDGWWKPEVLAKAADEIERLTAELQGTKDELHSVDKAAKELGAELDATKAVATYNRDMADRLRAALEYVDSYCSETLPDMVMDKIRQALAGVIRNPQDEYNHAGGGSSAGYSHAQPEETTVVHGCFCRDVELGNARSCPIHGPAENGEGSL